MNGARWLILVAAVVAEVALAYLLVVKIHRKIRLFRAQRRHREIEQRLREVYIMEHLLLDKRSVEEWDHDDLCSACKILSRPETWMPLPDFITNPQGRKS